MEPTSDFNFRETVAAVWQAASAVTCHILFDAAVHGLFVAAFILTVSLVLKTRKHRFARPLAFVARNIALLCVVFTIPGFISLAFTGKFPYTGVYNINSLGFLGFWGMVTVHLCFEEMNFQWFTKGPPPKELGEVEGYPTNSEAGSNGQNSYQNSYENSYENSNSRVKPDTTKKTASAIKPANGAVPDAQVLAENGTLDFTPPEPKDGADRPEEHLEAARQSK